MQLLITIDDIYSSNPDKAVFRQIIDLELERCPVCSNTYLRTGHLPFHCHNCFTLRDERWLRFLVRRTKSLYSLGASNAD